MGASIEAELRLLVQEVSERATLGGGLDRPTYDALRAASVALSSQVLAGPNRDQLEALWAMRERLRACEVGPYVKAA